MGPVTRFPSAKKLVSYAGLAPGIRQSADHTVHGRITRDGNKYIRWILIEAAQNASRFDPKLRPFYLRVAARRGHQKAITALARKMLVSIYHVLKRQETYHGQRDELLERKINRLTTTNSRLKPSSKMRQPTTHNPEKAVRTFSMVRGVGFAHQFTSNVYPTYDELLQGSVSYKRFKLGRLHHEWHTHKLPERLPTRREARQWDRWESISATCLTGSCSRVAPSVLLY